MLTLAEPLTAEAAAWIRDHAWTPAKRALSDAWNLADCACSSGLTTACEYGTHERCRFATGPHCEAFIKRPDGVTPARFAEAFAHPAPYVTGTGPTNFAMVWLADRVCRWVCPCTCHAPAAPVRPRQLDLFEVMA